MPIKSKCSWGVVILGAGVSSRMGRPKLLLPWGDTTIIGHLVAQWRGVGARQIALVCRRADGPLKTELRRIGFPACHCIVNPRPERGMFSSIVCAVRWNGWMAGLTGWVIVLGDQPHLRTTTLRTLLAFHHRNPHAICQPVFAGHRRHPVVLPREAFVDLPKSGARTLKELLQQTTFPLMECPIEDSGLDLDLDSPEDYKKLAPG